MEKRWVLREQADRKKVKEIAEMLEKGKDLPGDRRLAKLLKERAEPAKREYDDRWRPGALSQEEIDSMLVGIPEKRNPGN